jgi:hypothetical protein
MSQITDFLILENLKKNFIMSCTAMFIGFTEISLNHLIFLTEKNKPFKVMHLTFQFSLKVIF